MRGECDCDLSRLGFPTLSSATHGATNSSSSSSSIGSHATVLHKQTNSHAQRQTGRRGEAERGLETSPQQTDRRILPLKIIRYRDELCSCSFPPPLLDSTQKMSQTPSNDVGDGVVTLDMIKDVHRKVLDANPIYEFLLAGVSHASLPRQAHLSSPRLAQRHLQLEITSVSPGEVQASVPVTRNMMNSHNILHGSTSGTIIDWIGGMVIASTSPERASKRGVSVDIHATYVGSAKESDTLLITGRSNKVGRNLAFISVEIRSRPANGGEPRMVVTGSHTKYVG